eukprot:756273-Prorocentrum_lima.AAC.1
MDCAALGSVSRSRALRVHPAPTRWWARGACEHAAGAHALWYDAAARRGHGGAREVRGGLAPARGGS